MSTNEWAKPESKALASFFTDLIFLDVTAKISATPWTPQFGAPLAIASYRSDANTTAGLVVMELASAGALGAALSRIPAAVATDAVRTKKLPDNIAENLREVFNVSAALLNAKGHPHVVFDKAYFIPPTPPQEIMTLMMKPHWKLDLDLSVQGYGAGKFSFRLAAPLVSTVPLANV